MKLSKLLIAIAITLAVVIVGKIRHYPGEKEFDER